MGREMSSFRRIFDTYSQFQFQGLEDDAAMLTLAVAVLEHAEATRAIAHGGVSGATGLEGLAMALAGGGMGTPVSSALSGLGDPLERIASSLEAIEGRAT